MICKNSIGPAIGKGLEALGLVVDDEVEEAKFREGLESVALDEVAAHVPEGVDLGVEEESALQPL